MSEQYVATSERELEKLIGVMREFMRDQRNMHKAMAVMHATNEFQAVAAEGYRAAKAGVGNNKELELALDNFRQ